VVAAANDTAAPPRNTVLADFLDTARRRPDAVAIVEDGLTTTYGELLRAATGVRNLVRDTLGEVRGAAVGLAERRGAALAACVLGVWAAGAAYLPLDPDHPADRLAFELDDVGCRLVLGDQLPAACRGDRLCVPVPDPADTALTDGTRPDDLAYVIYTSGSTGRPKGVELTHANLANVVGHFADEVDPGAAMLWLTTFAFDISALELCLPLATGGRVVVAPDEARTDPARLLALVDANDVSVVQATPTTWHQVAPHAAGRLAGRTVFCGGEALSPSLAEQLVATGCRLINVYGPTETTIWSTSAEITGGPVVVGR
jgi:non-ribosomal peptide synthetase component F